MTPQQRARQQQQQRTQRLQQQHRAQQQRTQRIRQQIGRLNQQRKKSSNWQSPAMQPAVLNTLPPLQQSLYDQAENRYTRDKDIGEADIAQRQRETEQRYGFGQSMDVNPYSEASKLQRSLDTANKVSNTSYAAQGQLYAGSLSNARQYNRGQYDEGYDTLRKNFDAELANLARRKLDLATDYQDATYDAYANSVRDATELDLDPSTAPANPYRPPQQITKQIQALKNRLKQRPKPNKPKPQQQIKTGANKPNKPKGRK